MIKKKKHILKNKKALKNTFPQQKKHHDEKKAQKTLLFFKNTCWRTATWISKVRHIKRKIIEIVRNSTWEQSTPLNLNRKYTNIFVKISWWFEFFSVRILFLFPQFCVQGKCSNTVGCSPFLTEHILLFSRIFFSRSGLNKIFPFRWTNESIGKKH